MSEDRQRESRWERFNVNDRVRVKLTEKGKRVLQDDYEELRRRFPKLGCFELRLDSEGRYETQMWCLMRDFGPHTNIGSHGCFETEIELLTRSESGAIDYKRGYEYLQDRLESIGYHGWAHDMDEEIRRTQSATASIADNLPLICKAIGGHLDMRIGEKTLAFATLHCPALWDADADRGRFRVTNPAEFAKAVGHELNKEAEDGSTRLTRMLDGAIQEAINQGAEGIEEIDALDSRILPDK